MKQIKFKTLFLTLLLSVPMHSCLTANSADNALENSITKVIKAFKDKTSDINAMIHPKTGLFIVHRPGIFDTYIKLSKIDFKNPSEYLPRSDFEPSYTLNYESLPTYDCDEEKWSKTGLYCDLTTRDHLLSETAYNMKKQDLGTITPETIETFKALEQDSHRVVLVDKNGNAFIFYLTQIENKWYVTILDKVSGDCSA